MKSSPSPNSEALRAVWPRSGSRVAELHPFRPRCGGRRGPGASLGEGSGRPSPSSRRPPWVDVRPHQDKPARTIERCGLGHPVGCPDRSPTNCSTPPLGRTPLAPRADLRTAPPRPGRPAPPDDRPLRMKGKDHILTAVEALATGPSPRWPGRRALPRSDRTAHRAAHPRTRSG